MRLYALFATSYARSCHNIFIVIHHSIIITLKAQKCHVFADSHQTRTINLAAYQISLFHTYVRFTTERDLFYCAQFFVIVKFKMLEDVKLFSWRSPVNICNKKIHSVFIYYYYGVISNKSKRNLRERMRFQWKISFDHSLVAIWLSERWSIPVIDFLWQFLLKFITSVFGIEENAEKRRERMKIQWNILLDHFFWLTAG